MPRRQRAKRIANRTAIIRKGLARHPSITREILARQIGKIMVQKGIARKVSITGSAANLVANPNSDIDLLVSGATNKRAAERMATGFQRKFGVKIQLIFPEDSRETGTKLYYPLVNSAILVAGGTKAEQAQAKAKKAARKPFVSIMGGAYRRYAAETIQLAREGKWPALLGKVESQPVAHGLAQRIRKIIGSKRGLEEKKLATAKAVEEHFEHVELSSQW